MNCKNCNHTLDDNAQFCDNCGGKVVAFRITFAILFKEFFNNVFGLDTQFFRTLKEMAIRPHLVLEEYLSGVRKRYVNPFGFLAISAAVSLLIYNFFIEDYVKMQRSINEEQIIEVEKKASINLDDYKNLTEKEFEKIKRDKTIAKLQLKFTDNYTRLSVRYFNLFCFIFIFILALVSKWTYWKPHNYGEHIIINAYMYGFLSLFQVLLFLISLVTHPWVFIFSTFGYLFYYQYTLSKFYNISLGKGTIKFLRFLLGFLILFSAIIVLGIVIAFIYLLVFSKLT